MNRSKAFCLYYYSGSIDNKFRASKSSAKVPDLRVGILKPNNPKVLVNYKSSFEEDVIEMVLWSSIDACCLL